MSAMVKEEFTNRLNELDWLETPDDPVFVRYEARDVEIAQREALNSRRKL